MLQFVIGAIIFILIAVAIVILVVINFTYKGVRQLRKAAEEQFEVNHKRKEQKEKNPFGDDYFKSSDGSQHQSHQAHKPRQESQKTTTRRTTTSSGVTIIDEREADKKIFNHDDGEYVEFEEVN